METDVIIPTWNGAALLRSCLDHLARQTAPHHVIVVDNGSTDGTGYLVRREFPGVALVQLPTNLGFGRAVNRGAAAGGGAAIVVMNNDVDAEPDFVAELVAPLHVDGVGMASGVLIDPLTGHLDGAGVQIDRGLAGYAYLGGAAIAALERPPPGLLGPSGGAAAYRRAAFEAVGGFDDAIFAYSEDVDLALRLRGAGWSCALAPAARGRHVGSASFGKRSARQLAVAAEGRGYVLARYRIGARWLVLESLVALFNVLLVRSPAPVLGLVRGWRRATRSTRARVPPEVEHLAIGLPSAIRRRLAGVA